MLCNDDIFLNTCAPRLFNDTKETILVFFFGCGNLDTCEQSWLSAAGMRMYVFAVDLVRGEYARTLYWRRWELAPTGSKCSFVRTCRLASGNKVMGDLGDSHAAACSAKGGGAFLLRRQAEAEAGILAQVRDIDVLVAREGESLVGGNFGGMRSQLQRFRWCVCLV